jgi:hypothetical protein
MKGHVMPPLPQCNAYFQETNRLPGVDDGNLNLTLFVRFNLDYSQEYGKSIGGDSISSGLTTISGNNGNDALTRFDLYFGWHRGMNNKHKTSRLLSPAVRRISVGVVNAQPWVTCTRRNMRVDGDVGAGYVKIATDGTIAGISSVLIKLL